LTAIHAINIFNALITGIKKLC